MIYICSKFDPKEAKIIKVKDENAILCDKNTFSIFDFSGKEVKQIGDDKLTAYLVDKAVKMGAKKAK